MNEAPRPFIERVRAYLQGRGYVVEDTAPGLRIRVTRAEDEFPRFFFIPRRTVTLAVIAEPALRVADERRVEAAVLLARMNYGLLHGCFEMNPASGQLRYRDTLNFAGTPLTEDLIANLYRDCDVAMCAFLPVRHAFVDENAAPHEALGRFGSQSAPEVSDDQDGPVPPALDT
jgi:hypothetical protein